MATQGKIRKQGNSIFLKSRNTEFYNFVIFLKLRNKNTKFIFGIKIFYFLFLQLEIGIM